jgi:hypothetical protein
MAGVVPAGLGIHAVVRCRARLLADVTLDSATRATVRVSVLVEEAQGVRTGRKCCESLSGGLWVRAISDHGRPAHTEAPAAPQVHSRDLFSAEL